MSGAHGGARAGAGRPAAAVDPVLLKVKVEREIAEALDRWGEAWEHRTRAAALRDLLSRHLELTPEGDIRVVLAAPPG